MTKRQKFVVTSVLLSLGFLGLGALGEENRVAGVIGLSFVALFLAFLSLRESIGRNATLISLILPPLYTFGVGMFWFLLPGTFYAQLPVVLLFGVGVYAQLLIFNIFNVSTIKSIALARAAKGVGFVLTLFTAFLLYDAILSVKGPIYFNAVSVFASSVLLLIQGLWVSKLEKNVEKQLIRYSLILGYVVGGVSILLYFWPVSVVVGSLFLTVTMYVLLGLGQAKLEGRLFKSTMREYMLVGALVFMAMILATSWRG